MRENRLLRDVLEGRMLRKGLVGRRGRRKCWMILWLFRLKDRKKKKPLVSEIEVKGSGWEKVKELVARNLPGGRLTKKMMKKKKK